MPRNLLRSQIFLRVALAVFVLLAACYGYWQLKRVEQEHLFALALPMDRPPTALEILDARRSAQTYLIPAIVVILAMGGVIIANFHRLRSLPKPSRAWLIAAALFLLAALADLLTTLTFFHRHGVNYELHPGIRLFGYAYGLTIGPLSGKFIQAVGILLLALLTRRFGILLLIATSIVYTLAAIHNYRVM